MEQLTHPKTSVHKVASAWTVACPCGFTWHSRWHRIALLLATSHEHLRAVA